MPTPRKRPSRATRKRTRGQYHRPSYDELAEANGYRLLALDVSSVAAGWALFEGGKLHSCGVYPQQGTDHGERMLHFAEWLQEMFIETDPTHVVYEAPFQSRERHAFGVLMWYVGVMLAEHWRHFQYEIPDINRMPAREVKRLHGFPSGCSHAQNKRMAVDRVNGLYGFELKYDRTKGKSDDDVADAVLLGRAWLMRYHPDLELS